MTADNRRKLLTTTTRYHTVYYTCSRLCSTIQPANRPYRGHLCNRCPQLVNPAAPTDTRSWRGVMPSAASTVGRANMGCETHVLATELGGSDEGRGRSNGHKNALQRVPAHRVDTPRQRVDIFRRWEFGFSVLQGRKVFRIRYKSTIYGGLSS